MGRKHTHTQTIPIYVCDTWGLLQILQTEECLDASEKSTEVVLAVLAYVLRGPLYELPGPINAVILSLSLTVDTVAACLSRAALPPPRVQHELAILRARASTAAGVLQAASEVRGITLVLYYQFSFPTSTC